MNMGELLCHQPQEQRVDRWWRVSPLTILFFFFSFSSFLLIFFPCFSFPSLLSSLLHFLTFNITGDFMVIYLTSLKILTMAFENLLVEKTGD